MDPKTFGPPVDKPMLRIKAYRDELRAEEHPCANLIDAMLETTNNSEYLLENLKVLVRVMEGEFDHPNCS